MPLAAKFPTNHRWYWIPNLFITSSLAYLDTTNYSFARRSWNQKYLANSNSVSSLIEGLFYLVNHFLITESYRAVSVSLFPSLRLLG